MTVTDNTDETPPEAHATLPALLASALARAALDVARRAHAGATLWCLAPSWPEHARHVAVEFVHPVIIGKRALPAVAVTDPHPTDALRAVARPGDVLVALGMADEQVIVDVLRRAPAWGLTTLWLGCGVAPAAGSADHLIWLDDADRDAAHDGRLVLLYHVLWELTHVCFEHPDALDDEHTTGCPNGHCITCADDGRIGEVALVDGVGGRALVRTAEGVEWADVSLVDPVRPTDLVLLHAGTAVAVLP
jgi:hypothetical protein